MRTLVARVVFVLMVAAAVFTVIEGRALRELGSGLDTPAAPARIVSLELAQTDGEARAIRHDWTSRASVRGGPATLMDDARLSVERDDRFILAYVALGVLLVLWAGLVARYHWAWIVAIAACFIVGGVLDFQENIQLRATLSEAPDLSRSVMLGRLYAMSKFTLLLIGGAATVAATGAALRTIFGSKPDAGTGEPIQEFRDLIQLENGGIFNDAAKRTSDWPVSITPRDTEEPFVQFREADVIGMALSGGGIRSATFNLGLLQGLDRMDLLKLFDYAATVSGGGYIGAFWSEWLGRQRDRQPPVPVADLDLFPTARPSPNGRAHLDTPQERHLREFSGFLAPRWGFFEVETWTAIVAVLSGLLPALLTGLCVLGIALVGWLALTFPLASRSAWAPAVTLAAVTAGVLVGFEWMWQRFKTESAGHRQDGREPDSASHWLGWYVLFAVFGVVLVALLQARLPDFYISRFGGPWPIASGLRDWAQAANDSGMVRWWALAGISNPGYHYIFSPRLFDVAVTCVTASLALVAVRATHAARPWGREPLAVFDRVLMRVLGLGVFWTVFAVLWHVAINLVAVAAGAAGAAGGALVSGGAFAALRNWIGTSLRRPAEAGMLDRLRPYLPVLLAYLTIALSAAAAGAVLILIGGNNWMTWWTQAAGMATVLVLALFIQPDKFGLHAFYRDRICRAYAGACNLAEGETAADNRGTEPKTNDDRPMQKLAERPLHLVCCAANDLSGDQVETLGRGARSAVLSRYGISLGRYFHAWSVETDPKLGAAVTASAAAFNSNMGHVSMQLGPAVTFLMTALNLRLGLWVRHPAAAAMGTRRWPGLLLFREMFGLTSASGRIGAGKRPSAFLSDIHLSDGAHFENLALYELIRRHCRYVLVSDCGADPNVAFDDLGNVLRRVREDFGVDITLDVSALRPGAGGISVQHVAVGTIHYSDTDRGVLLYVKPSITGDEPTDVLQYRTRNAAFPHESTGDQFYDEAQWESYRRLGLHAAECIFDFVARDGDVAERRTADWVFAEAVHRWGKTPQGLEASVLAMTARFGQLEGEVQKLRAGKLFADVFPELQLRAVAAVYPAPPGPAPPGPEPPVDVAANLAFLLRVTQLMEEAWLTCRLDEWWDHPLNLGWINLFARWATCEEFRFWWPVLSPMFSPGFRSFIHHRFPMRGGAIPQKGTVGVLIRNPDAPGLAEVWLEERSAQMFNWGAAPPDCTRVFYENLLGLPRRGGNVVQIQTGIAGVTRHQQKAAWTSDDFFVPPSLWGAGIGWYFLKGLLEKEAGESTWCYVVVRSPDRSRNQVSQDDRRSFLDQYRKIGFREVRNADKAAGGPLDSQLREALKYKDGNGDTLLELDLAQWSARRVP